VDSWDQFDEQGRLIDGPHEGSTTVRKRPTWVKVSSGLVLVALTVVAAIRGNWISFGVGALLVLIVCLGALGLRRERRREVS
jgi:hypothetical protein